MLKIIEIFSVAVILLALAFVTTAFPTVTDTAEAKVRIRGVPFVTSRKTTEETETAKPRAVESAPAGPVRVINSETAAERAAAQQARANQRLVETGELKPSAGILSAVTEPTARATNGIVCLAGC
jgi:hypothetical protein